jgi:hypothetical protein
MKRLGVTAIVGLAAWLPALAHAQTRAQTIAQLNNVVAQVEALNIPGGTGAS